MHQEKGFILDETSMKDLPKPVATIVKEHKWEKFARHFDIKKETKAINVSLVKEFYAHFIKPR
mgnify:CR=1 FL=1